MPDISLYFTKASLHDDGTMHWAATVSDTGEDNHKERVDRALTTKSEWTELFSTMLLLMPKKWI